MIILMGQVKTEMQVIQANIYQQIRVKNTLLKLGLNYKPQLQTQTVLFPLASRNTGFRPLV
jgi:hypothetical protein